MTAKVNGQANKIRKQYCLEFEVGAFLQSATGGEDENLAGVNEVNVADAWIGADDARSVRSMAELRLRDLGECVAQPDCHFSGRLNRQHGKNNLRAGHDVIGIKNARVGRD